LATLKGLVEDCGQLLEGPVNLFEKLLCGQHIVLPCCSRSMATYHSAGGYGPTLQRSKRSLRSWLQVAVDGRTVTLQEDHAALDVTVEEGLTHPQTLCATEMTVMGNAG
jgi:hypothetical protein